MNVCIHICNKKTSLLLFLRLNDIILASQYKVAKTDSIEICHYQNISSFVFSFWLNFYKFPSVIFDLCMKKIDLKKFEFFLFFFFAINFVNYNKSLGGYIFRCDNEAIKKAFCLWQYNCPMWLVQLDGDALLYCSSSAMNSVVNKHSPGSDNSYLAFKSPSFKTLLLIYLLA